ncbi:hypothetical protein [Jannaschia seohaensis]|uniref:Flagellin n=1 Tax=Jannaschia seohaensis TaxID=475081 RepID=A0A2Y9A7T8_9RHOB|nr:hypothetical protein [Jannaschia seohaensis]PWJ22331.1 hypothetical protein BCF38_101742 [Jannaschia seohaensis]SSA38609.1 hypothetical protein SAMN05421539_101742 [Jannaschia seohaensis]
MRPEIGLARPLLGPNDITRDTRDRVDILSQEVASGRSSDLGRALRSDFSEVSRLTHQMAHLDAMKISLSRAETWGEGLQLSLAGVETSLADLAQGLATGLFSASTPGIVPDVAEGALRDIAAFLNGTANDRALFGNGAGDHPIQDIDAVLSDVRGLAAGAVDYETYAADVDAYFAPGGPFETTRLTIGANEPVVFPVGDGRTVSFEVDAGSSELIQAVKQAALAAGLDDRGFALAPGSTAAIDIQSRMLSATAALPDLRGRIGAVEERVSDMASSLDDRRSETEIALGETIGIDRFEAASALQNEMARLESLYAITARRAQLRLTDYL